MVSPQVQGRPASAYPFPLGEDPAQTKWWDYLTPPEQKRWSPVLRKMTADERAEFHAERRRIASERGFGSDWYFGQSVEFAVELELLDRWTQRTAGRAAWRATP